VNKKKLDNTLNKNKYDSAPTPIEAKTVKISQYSFPHTELQYRYTNKSYRRKTILSAKSNIQSFYPAHSTEIVKLL
jgi:hypothetical protein